MTLAMQLAAAEAELHTAARQRDSLRQRAEELTQVRPNCSESFLSRIWQTDSEVKWDKSLF